MKNFFYILFTILNIFSACHKTTKNETFDFKKGVFVINEGNFTYSNASLSFIDFDKDTIYNDVFFRATSFPLGDVAQSITLWNKKAFLVINNSGKIFVIDNSTAKYIATISDLSSPRYITIINNSKAYISDLYSTLITVVNPETFKITGTINVGCSIEQMLLLGNFIYAINWNKGNKIVKIDINNDQIIDSLSITYQPNSIILDKNNKLWILSDGGNDSDTTKNQIPTLSEINPDNLQIEKNIIVGNRSNSPTHLQINYSGDTLYYINSSWSNNTLNGGIFKMPINSDKAPTQPFIKQENRLFYSLFVTNDNKILVSDAIDYVQPGIILIYNNSGILIHKYRANIIPSNFAEKY